MKNLLTLSLALATAAMLLAQAPAQKKAAPGAPAKKDAKAKKEEPKIEGQEIARKDGGYLGLMIAEGKFKLSFYDKEKKPIAPDVKMAVMRWSPTYQRSDERVVLSAAGKNTMSSERVIRPPYSFKLFMTLLKDAAEGDPVGETFVVDFRQ